MKIVLIVMLAFLPFAAKADLNSSAIPTDASKIRFVQGRILVQPKAGLSEKEFDLILKPHQAKRTGKLSQINVHIVSVPAQTEIAVANALSKNKHISFAEIDAVVQPTLNLNDPQMSSAWQIPKINAPEAWEYSSGVGVLVADCDTGVDSDHPDLQGNLESSLGWNTASNNNLWEDINGHGTATTGVMAAVGNNNTGAAGVAYKTKVIPVRVSDLTDGSASVSALASCVTYAADKGARGANLSYSGMCSSSTIFNAAAYMRNKTGGIVVASAGNSSGLINANDNTNITCVAATDSLDRRASFSSYGNYVDVAAPGVSTYVTTRGGGYGLVSGTSFSSPITLGVYALMMQVNPNLSPSQLDQILFTNALDLGTAGKDIYFGHGRVNAEAAVISALNYTANDTQPPTLSFVNPAQGSNVYGTMNVNLAATDNIGVKSVTLTVNNIKYEDSTAPYEFSIDTTGFQDGPLKLNSSATDEAGNVAQTSIDVNVFSASADNTPPTVAFSNPTNGAAVKGNVNVSVSAADNSKLSKVELMIDGRIVSTLITANPSSVLTYSWNACSSRSKCTGTSTLKATAYDAAQNPSSATIVVTKKW